MMSNKQSHLKNAMLTGLLTVSLAGFTAPVFAKPGGQNGGGNPIQECQEHDASYFAKYNWENGEYVKSPDSVGEIDIDGDETSGTWSSDTFLNVMIVKGGTLRDPTLYNPAANSGSFDNDEIENKDISHITFCRYDLGVCVLDFANVQPPVSYNGYPDYFNEDGFHVHSITNPWDSVVVNRFLSCYDAISSEAACEKQLDKTKHIWYPLPDGQDALVTSAHWFTDATSCAQLKAEGILPAEVKLLATGVELTATKNGSGVDLTLTTDAEPDTAALLILRGDKLENGGTKIDVACSFPSGGSPYTCTDDPAADTYRAAEIEYDGSLIIYDEVTPK